jgi:hypothetical protein
MEPDMKVSGSKTNRREKEKKCGLMALVIKEITLEERNMVRASSFGPMVACTKENSKTII